MTGFSGYSIRISISISGYSENLILYLNFVNHDTCQGWVLFKITEFCSLVFLLSVFSSVCFVFAWTRGSSVQTKEGSHSLQFSSLLGFNRSKCIRYKHPSTNCISCLHYDPTSGNYSSDVSVCMAGFRCLYSCYYSQHLLYQVLIWQHEVVFYNKVAYISCITFILVWQWLYLHLCTKFILQTWLHYTIFYDDC